MFNLLKSVLIHNHWQNRSFLMLEKSLMPVAQWAGAACFFSPRDHLHSHSPLPGRIHPLFWISYCCFLGQSQPYFLIPITVIKAYILDQTTALPSVPAITVPVLDHKVKMAADSSGLHWVLSQLSWLRLPLRPGQPAATFMYLSLQLWGVDGGWHYSQQPGRVQQLLGRETASSQQLCLFTGNECQECSHTLTQLIMSAGSDYNRLINALAVPVAQGEVVLLYL